MIQPPKDSRNVPQVMAFIHSYLSRLGFSLRRNVIDYYNILLLFFFNREKYYFLMNVYLDNHHSAAKFMLDQYPQLVVYRWKLQHQRYKVESICFCLFCSWSDLNGPDWLSWSYVFTASTSCPYLLFRHW